MRRCQGCQWSRDVMPFRDADGAQFHLCPDCRPAGEAEKRATLEARQRARQARERETLGQMRLEGTGMPHGAPEGPLRLF